MMHFLSLDDIEQQDLGCANQLRADYCRFCDEVDDDCDFDEWMDSFCFWGDGSDIFMTNQDEGLAWRWDSQDGQWEDVTEVPGVGVVA